MGIVSSILSFVFGGGGLFTAACLPLAPAEATSSVSIVSSASASGTPDARVVVRINGKTSTSTLSAPYGVQSSIVERIENGRAVTEATATPMTESQAQGMQKRMDELMAEQQKVFDDLRDEMRDEMREDQYAAPPP